MKKLLFIYVLALGFTACNNEEDVAPSNNPNNVVTTPTNPNDSTTTTDTTTTSGDTTVVSNLGINTWKTYDVFRLHSVILADNFVNPGSSLTLKLTYSAPGNGTSGNIDLTFKGSEIKAGIYKVTDQAPANDDEVKFSGSLVARPGSSKKSVWLLNEEKQTQKVKVEVLTNGDYLVTMAPTKVQQVSGSNPYNDVIETKVQFNLNENTFNGQVLDGAKFQRYSTGSGKITSEVALTSGAFGSAEIKLLFTGVDFWAGDIASNTVTLETNNSNVLSVDGVYVDGNKQPKPGSTVTYKVENGVFTGTMTNVVLTDGTTDETVSAEFYIVL